MITGDSFKGLTQIDGIGIIGGQQICKKGSTYNNGQDHTGNDDRRREE